MASGGATQTHSLNTNLVTTTHAFNKYAVLTSIARVQYRCSNQNVTSLEEDHFHTNRAHWFCYPPATHCLQSIQINHIPSHHLGASRYKQSSILYFLGVVYSNLKSESAWFATSEAADAILTASLISSCLVKWDPQLCVNLRDRVIQVYMVHM